LRERESEEAELERYIEVLQARKNNMASGKKADGPSGTSPNEWTSQK